MLNVSVDPKANASQSPYMSMSGNPIMYNDPLGDTVKFAGANEEQLYNDYRGEVNGQINAVSNQIGGLQNRIANGWKIWQGMRNRKLDRLQNLKKSYESINMELNSIESSTDIFRVRSGSNSSNTHAGGNLAFNKNTGEVDININNALSMFSDIQKISHELKHAYQFTQSELDLHISGKGGLAYDITDEYEAFHRQNLFSYTLGGTYTQNVESFVRNNYSTSLPRAALSVSNVHDIGLLTLAETAYAYHRASYPAFITSGYTERFNGTRAKWRNDQSKMTNELINNLQWQMKPSLR